ncbi:MAG: DUF2147 domain-containing protein [Sphingomonadales bacterium]|nr:DUF2147 domain-containing protein [Sphingomonadales bacterium]
MALLSSAAVLATDAARLPVDPTGIWRNPDGTLQVRIEANGPKLTGEIVWAAPEAIVDARESGVREPLIGTQLLQDYRRSGANSWHGKVYVPDMQGTFFSNIVAKADTKLDISGCILRGLICKHQTWQRV